MFIQIAEGIIVNFLNADIVKFYPAENENIIRMIFPSRMVLEMKYGSKEESEKVINAVLSAIEEGKHTFSLLKENMEPDSVQFDCLAAKE